MLKFAYGALLITIAVLSRSAIAAPLFSGTAFYAPGVVVAADPSVFSTALDKGQGLREVYDRRTDARSSVNMYLFEFTGSDGSRLEARVNSEFGSVDAARVEALRYAKVIGQLPWAVRRNVKVLVVHKGDNDFGGSREGSVLVHTGRTAGYDNFGNLEEIMIHEASHASLDERHVAAPGWLAAQAADADFISTYARDNPTREDVAESYLMYLAARDTRGRVTESLKAQILSVIPHRIAYFDNERVLDWAERAFPEFFSPAGQTTLSLNGYRYRAYAGGNFLAVKEGAAPQLLYLGPISNNIPLDLGLLSKWVLQASP